MGYYNVSIICNSKHCRLSSILKQYPASRGSIHIKSANDQRVLNDYQPGFFRKYARAVVLIFTNMSLRTDVISDADIATLRWGYKKAREIARRMDVYQGEFVGPGHPIFPTGSPAATGQTSGPVSIDAPDIAYTNEDDTAIDLYSRNAGRYIYIYMAIFLIMIFSIVKTSWHSVC